MKCDGCSYTDPKFVTISGSRTPHVYFIGDYPNEIDLQDKTPMSIRNDYGKVFHKLIADAGIVSYRVTNTLLCKDKGEDPAYNNIKYCTEVIKADIKKTKPKVIVVLGRVALQVFMKVTKDSGSLVKIRKNSGGLSFENIPIIIAYHPKYIVQRGGITSPYYLRDLLEPIRNSINFLKNKGKVLEYKILFPDALDKLEELFPEEEINLDIEATSLNTLSQDLCIIGYGITSITNAGYLVIKSFEYDFENHYNECWKTLLNFFKKKKKIKIFNLSYEGKAFYNKFHDKFNFWDVYQDAKLLDYKQGLKDLVFLKLGKKNWGDNFWILTNDIKLCIKSLYHGKKGQTPFSLEFQELGILKYIEKYSQMDLDGETKKLQKFYGALTEIVKYYEEDELELLQKEILRRAEAKLGDDEVPTDLIKTEMTAKYCVEDTAVLDDLEKVLVSEMNEKELGVRELFQQHAQIGIEMEINGITWDDELAEKLKLHYEQEQVKHLRDLILHERFLRINGTRFSQAVIMKIASTNSLKELKTYYNPNSNTPACRHMFLDCIDSTDFRCGRLAYELSNIENLKLYPNFKKIFDKEETNFGKYTRLKKFLQYEEVFDVLTPREIGVIAKLIKTDALAKTDALTIEYIHKILIEFMGCDIDDDTTWSEEMTLLYHFRSFKKVSKSLSTYILGSVGRDGVWIVERDPYIANTDLTKKRRYGELRDQGEMYVLQPEYQVNTAITKRWTSKIHTIPAQCELRDLSISRFGDDGLLFHIDYSQMEMRMLACMAGDESMINAFLDGYDIHRFIASQMYQKEMKDVTPVERKSSKCCSFSVIYGKMIEGIARDHFNGNVALATQIVNSFYSGFPLLKDYFDGKLQEWKDNGYVTTHFGDKIYIPLTSNTKGAYNQVVRFTMNYPIQHSASMASGYGIFRLMESIENKALSKIFGFTHDAVDVDCHMSQFTNIFNLSQIAMRDRVKNDLKIPVEIDSEIGLRGNSMVEMKLNENDDGSYGIKFEGQRRHLNDILDKLRVHYDVDDLKIEEEEEKFISRAELFMAKRAYSMEFGTHKVIQSGSFILSDL